MNSIASDIDITKDELVLLLQDRSLENLRY